MKKKWIYLLLTACVRWSCSGNEEQTLVLNSEADLAGLRIATQSGSCYDIELSPRTDIELQCYNTLSDAIQALRHGNADVLLNDLNRPLDIKFYDVTAAIMAIKTGKADLLSGGVFITPERQQEFSFGDSYYYFHSTYFALDRDSENTKGGFVARCKHAIHKNLLAEDRWRFITDGLLLTLIISFFAILFGSLFGIVVYRMGESRLRWVRRIAAVYNGFIAGIPELVRLLM